MLRRMVTTGRRLLVGAGVGAGREGAARCAEGRHEKAQNDQQRTDAREETVLAGAHDFIVRGMGCEGIVFWRRSSADSYVRSTEHLQWGSPGILVGCPQNDNFGTGAAGRPSGRGLGVDSWEGRK